MNYYLAIHREKSGFYSKRLCDDVRRPVFFGRKVIVFKWIFQEMTLVAIYS